MLKEEIKNVIMSEMFENCMRSGIVEKNLEGNLKADRSNILVNENKYLTYVPEKVYINDEYIVIHGNTRNLIAKEFINKYSYKDIRKAFEKKLEEENKHLQLEEDNKNKLESLLQLEEIKYFSTLKDNELQVKFNHCINKYYIELKYYTNKHIYIIEIFNNNDYKNYIFKNGCDKKIVNKDGLIEILKDRINESKVYEEEKRIKEEKEKQKKHILINLMEILSDNKVLFKNKNSYFVVDKCSLRYAVGKGKSGKYYNTDFQKIYKMVLEKNIKEYYILKDNSINLRDNEVLKNLDYSIIY